MRYLQLWQLSPTETMLNVNEIVGSSGTRRLVFDGSEEYSQPFSFAAANTQTYQIVNVTIKVHLCSHMMLAVQGGYGGGGGGGL